MQISAVPKEINEWSGSVLIAGILEGTIESQINLFKTIIKDTFLIQRFIDSKFEGKKNQKLSIELIEGKVKKVMPAQRYTFFPNISFAIRAQAKLVPACKIGDESLTAHSAFPKKRVVT